MSGVYESIKVDSVVYNLVRTWEYRNPDGSILFYRARYEDADKRKEIRPFYEKNGRIVMKQPPGVLLPPLNADELWKNQKAGFLLVEGEKCATCQTAENIKKDTGVIVSTLATTPEKSDLSLLRYRDGYYLPDPDDAGYKKALSVKEALPRVQVIPPFPEWGPGESIDDHEVGGLDFWAYVETVDFLGIPQLKKLLGLKDEPEDSGPFSFLGYDDKRYYFLPKAKNIPISIPSGNSALKNSIDEIADHDWWFQRFQKETKQGIAFDLNAALTWVRKSSERKGIFNPDAILGVGPHQDGDDIIINTGRDLMYYGNGRIEYGQYKGELLFIRSMFKFEIEGKPWTKKERLHFIKQVMTFRFEKQSQMLAVIGWCAIAPFASLLSRCPHIWLTASKGTGKTHLIDNIIEPAIGKFLIKVEGKTSEAGVRQSIGKDCRPVIMDEFEANNRFEMTTIENVLGLARSAYGGSEIIKGSTSHAAVHFRTKMMFCFSSVKTYLSNAANASRIVVVRMLKSHGKMAPVPEMAGLKKMMFERLKELMANCKLAKKYMLKCGYDERTSDTYSPLLTGFWMIMSDQPFMSGEAAENRFVTEAILDIKEDATQEDEDRVLEHIFDYSVKIDPSTSLTIAELLTTEATDGSGIPGLKYEDILKRLGMKRLMKDVGGTEREVLAVAANHQEIRKIMADTAFTEYREIIARHPAFLPGNGSKFPVMFLTKNTRVVLLDWQMLQKEFFNDALDDEDDEIPF